MLPHRWRAACLIVVALVLPVLQVAAQEDPQINDAGVLAIFDQMNALEIAIGRTAAERGVREDVRKLGQTIVTDQEAQQRQGRELGYRLKIYAGPRQNELGSYSTTVSRLQSTPAAEFDQACLKQQIVIEQNVVDALSHMSPWIRAPELATFLREVVGNFERHLAATKAASASSGK